MLTLRKCIPFMATLGLSFVSLACHNHPITYGTMDTKEEKASYAMGHNIGENLKRQSLNYDLPSLCGGLTDAIEDNKSKLSDSEMKGAMVEFQNLAVNQVKEKAEENKKNGDAFLESNKTKAGWHTTNSGLQYQVIREGNGSAPKATDVVKLNYVGTTVAGTKFESSNDLGQPIETVVANTIPGWQEALKLIKPGGEIQVVLPPNLAYGERGHGSLGPNATVMFDISLLDIKADSGSLTNASTSFSNKIKSHRSN